MSKKRTSYKGRLSQQCTRVADYFMLPFPDEQQKKIVEALPVCSVVQKWIPVAHGYYIVATNVMNVSDLVGFESYAHVSCVVKQDKFCPEVPSIFIEEIEGISPKDRRSVSVRFWNEITESVQRAFQCYELS